MLRRAIADEGNHQGFRITVSMHTVRLYTLVAVLNVIIIIFVGVVLTSVVVYLGLTRFRYRRHQRHIVFFVIGLLELQLLLFSSYI